MSNCIELVEKDVDKVFSKFTEVSRFYEKTFDDLICQIQSYQRDLEILTAPESYLTDIQKALLCDNVVKKVKNIITNFSSSHRDIHSSVSKVGKTIDKHFISDYVCVGNETLFDEPDNANTLIKVIVEHFLRQGKSDIAEELMKEAKLDTNLESNSKVAYLKMDTILDSLKNRNLQPALEWTRENKDHLARNDSNLEFKLHRLRFIELLRGGIQNQMELINYSRLNFTGFADKYSSDIQVLMGSLMCLKSGIENSPYAYLFDVSNWSEICALFTKEACSLLGVSVESPLSVTTNAGCVALPALINIKQAIQQRHVTGVWTSRDELPIETRKCHYHSIFACPILRQQSSENNPPMKLTCGHVISRDALNKLSNGSKLKCPYCPVEQNPADAKLIHF